jgi:hypothetical protein
MSGGDYSFLNNLRERLIKWGNSIPDCPSCRGTGLPPAERPHAYDDVFWMGQRKRVCWQCKGAGKI